jgi:hypothetical protein
VTDRLAWFRTIVAAALVVTGVGLAAGCKEPTATPDLATGSGAIPGEMASVEADAERIAPALESWFRSHGYATNLAEAKQAITDAGLAPTPPNVVGSYRYDDSTVEFVLCIETPSGVHADYDTRPMRLRTAGASGGCAQE